MKKALLVIDFINDIAHPDGRIATSAAHVVEQDAIVHANQALAHARAHGWLVVLIKVGFDGNSMLQPKDSPMFGRAKQFGALSLADNGTDFHPELDVQPGDLVLTKPRVSPFYGTALEPALRANHIDHLYLCGVSTCWAIQAAAREGHDRDYAITILEDACAAADTNEHHHSLRQLGRIAEIIKVAQLA
ncbi:isochorismatase family protein [Aeromonas sp. 2MA4]|uniref:isochorismatase family cysteine hydrolase n=1 Tax=Aeromonas sp. 2MA4 TaxID=2699195 RepID=UPI0023DDEB9A|nr:isochorismatase family cysteine hydrolase [Aeromonas sp. 2MA4]MDF2390235.1 isochorismatase family protein [Aeromonas sp. 2MA4]